MSDVDSNGVDVLDRFRAYSERFRQFSVAEEVYLDTLEYIKLVRMQRDEARREIMNSVIDQACSNEEIEEEYKKRGWSYLKKENTNVQ
jgi:hypothetical protein